MILIMGFVIRGLERNIKGRIDVLVARRYIKMY